MTPEMLTIIQTEQAGGLRRLADQSTAYLGLMDRRFLVALTTPSITEAAAAKEITKGGIATDLAGINAGHNTPNPTAK